MKTMEKKEQTITKNYFRMIYSTTHQNWFIKKTKLSSFSFFSVDLCEGPLEEPSVACVADATSEAWISCSNTPLPWLNAEYRLTIPILEKWEERTCEGSDLVNMPANWEQVGACAVGMLSGWILSWIKWQSTSMCLVNSWKNDLRLCARQLVVTHQKHSLRVRNLKICE